MGKIVLIGVGLLMVVIAGGIGVLVMMGHSGTERACGTRAFPMRASRTESAPRRSAARRADRSRGHGRAPGRGAARAARPARSPPLRKPPPPLPPRRKRRASPKVAAPRGIEAQPLAPADASWLGTLGEDQGAFPRNMWRGTPRALVAAALPLLAAVVVAGAAGPGAAAAAEQRRRRPPARMRPTGRASPRRGSTGCWRWAMSQGALAMMDSLPADPERRRHRPHARRAALCRQ